MNLKDFLKYIVIDEAELLEEWNKRLEDITVKVRLIDKESNTI